MKLIFIITCLSFLLFSVGLVNSSFGMFGICLLCGKEFTIKKNTVPKKIYCSKSCTTRAYQLKNKEKYNDRRSELYLINKEREDKVHAKYREIHRDEINKKARESKIKNKIKWNERKFVQRHRAEFITILGDKCAFCKNESTDFHHDKYEDLPHDNFLVYSKFIIPMCNYHHSIFHKIVNRIYQKQEVLV